MSDELPDGWANAKLGDICSRPQYGWTSKASRTGRIKYLRTTDISGGTIDWSSVPCCADEPDDVGKYEIRPDDILVSRAGSVGVSIRVEQVASSTVFASYLIRFRAREGVHPKFVEAFLKSEAYWSAIAESSAGIAIPNVNASKLADIELPIPPTSEQRRIVAKLEELLGKVDASRARLAKIPALLKRFRQSVLAAACSGRLTTDWRTNRRNVNLVPPEPANSGEIVAVDSIVDVPVTWRWVPLVSLCDPDRAICYGVIKLGSEVPDGIPCLRTSDVRSLRIDTDGVKRISTQISGEYRRTLLRGGEVLVNVRGTLGGVAVVPDALRGWNISREVAVVPVSGLVAEFMAFWIASQTCQNWLAGVAKGVAYTGINIEDLRLLPVALPPLPEQQEIVRRVEALFALADKIEARFQQAQARVEQLTPALLAQAFRGELVPQNPVDEPASLLLERLRTDKRTSYPEAASYELKVAEVRPRRKGRAR